MALFPGTALTSLTAYLACAGLLLVCVWRSPAPLGCLPQASHALNLALLCFAVVFTGAATGPVFLYVAFPLVGAMLRWQWRGVLWTAGVVLAAHTGLGLVAANVVGSPAVQPARIAKDRGLIRPGSNE